MFAGHIGEIAAFLTATSWAMSCQIYSSAGKDLGATGVTMLRLPLCVLLMAILFVCVGAEANLEPKVILLLSASALAGLVICDSLLYKSAMIIGPRLASLVQSLCSCITAVLGWFFLGEVIGWVGFLGIAIAISGVFFVLADGGNLNNFPNSEAGRPLLLRGVLMALLSAVALSVSFIIMKQAILLGSGPTWATFYRLACGSLMLILFTIIRGTFIESLRSLKSHPRTWKLLPSGALVGTFGIWMSGIAVQNTETAVATTILALQPVVIIPINAIWEKRRPSVRAIVGTLIAFSGIAVMLMRNRLF
ncbi:DMT family transporter [Desulfovibrio sp. OttesenSCG-928-C06]|nr:DMT family transporter [Desulfovibrio sp. OttesenSCG-928-C06]